jgi:hypothetical protein
MSKEYFKKSESAGREHELENIEPKSMESN